jgi:hypothetical protein
MRQILPSLKNSAITAAVPILLMLWANPSMAQLLLPFGTVSWPGLTQDDIDRMHAAGARLRDGEPIGTVERWRSPESQDSGEIKLIRSFTANGMPCLQLNYLIRFQAAQGSPQHYVANWCKIDSGEWKIVELPLRR